MEIDCDEKYCGNCHWVATNFCACRLFPQYQRKGMAGMYILKWDDMRRVRDPDCLKSEIKSEQLNEHSFTNWYVLTD
jgi:hypothetical protein